MSEITRELADWCVDNGYPFEDAEDLMETVSKDIDEVDEKTASVKRHHLTWLKNYVERRDLTDAVEVISAGR